jgi:CHAT domain-containing protein/Tfp pilus assembly protein PilF
MARLYSAIFRLPIIIIAAVALLSNSSSFARSQNELLEEARKLNVEVFNLYNNGRYADAIPLAQRALAIFEKELGPDHPNVGTSLNNLAVLYENLGHYGGLETLYQRSLAIREKALGPNNPAVALSLHSLAELYVTQGRYADAEPFVMRALTINEKAFGPDHPAVATSLNDLAIVYEKQNRYAQSESLYQRALAIREKVLGPDHPDVAVLLDNLSVLYGLQGRYSEAEELTARSLTITVKMLGSTHPDVAASLGNLASLYDKEGRYSDAEPVFKLSLAIREKTLGLDYPDVANSLNYLALLYDKQGRDEEAESLYKRALAIREKVLGPDHPDVAQSLNNLASVCDKQGRYADAYAYIQQTFVNKSSRKYPSFSVIQDAGRSKLITAERSITDSFNVLQFTSSSAAAEAVQKLAQRYAAGTDALAEIVRHDQDLITETDGIDKAFIAAVSSDPKQRDQSNEDRMRARLSEISSERLKIATVLTQRFPDYVALSNPQPLTLNETQELLSDDEAVVAIDIDGKSYVWVVTKTDANWTEIPANKKMLNDEIATLRQSLTFNVDKPFDTALAYQIYQQTLGPIADRFASKKRISVITNGSLTSIPLQLLVTSDPTGKALKDVDWLVKSAAITVIPSIYSLKTMRAQKRQSTAPKPMIAYADPIFSKTARKETHNVALRSMTSFYSGTQINVQALAETLDQLPSTKDEVVKVAKALNAPASDIRTGLEATEAAVKQARLDQYRIVYFATHALVTGDLKAFAQAKAEPALVLTIPDKPTEEDDGLLQASEVSELKLNADWVVLSACNTAASDGAGAEALSGLARAFLYAGARSLVVSHWDVLDDKTAQLMSELFTRSSQSGSLSHGEALQQAQLRMLNNAKNDEDAHPRVWAPFVVVGEPMKPN